MIKMEAAPRFGKVGIYYLVLYNYDLEITQRHILKLFVNPKHSGEGVGWVGGPVEGLIINRISFFNLLKAKSWIEETNTNAP